MKHPLLPSPHSVDGCLSAGKSVMEMAVAWLVFAKYVTPYLATQSRESSKRGPLNMHEQDSFHKWLLGYCH